MIQIILFDCDGLIVKHNKYFSQRLQDLGYEINHHKVAEFFKGEFLECEKGNRDLKQVLPGWMSQWGWQGNTDDLLKFWFEGEAETDQKILGYIKTLRESGIKCYLATNNEKYRAEYLWENVGLKNLLHGLYASWDLGNLKFESGYWDKLYKNFKETPKQNILLWDDDQRNVNAAKQAGFKAELYENFDDYKKVMTEKYKIVV